jgi:hypothetical protein
LAQFTGGHFFCGARVFKKNEVLVLLSVMLALLSGGDDINLFRLVFPITLSASSVVPLDDPNSDFTDDDSEFAESGSSTRSWRHVPATAGGQAQRPIKTDTSFTSLLVYSSRLLISCDSTLCLRC